MSLSEKNNIKLLSIEEIENEIIKLKKRFDFFTF